MDDPSLVVQKWKAPYTNAIAGDHHNSPGSEIALDLACEQQELVVLSPFKPKLHRVNGIMPSVTQTLGKRGRPVLSTRNFTRCA